MGEPQVSSIDPALLAPVGSVIPASALLEQHGGTGGVLRFQGDWSSVGQLAAADLTLAARFLRQAAAITVAEGAAPYELPFDLRAANRAESEPWVAGFLRSPHAALAATLLVRKSPKSVWAGLVAESATYSMLQSGPAFASWLAGFTGGAADDDGARVRLERHPGLAEIVLTRPARHNALDVRLRDELYDTLVELDAEPDVAIAVRGEGPSFSSGGDLGEFGTFPEPATAHVVRLSRSLALRFANLGSRMVVGIHGTCLGSGIELPAFAARVIAADDTKIGLPEAAIGLIPGAGGTVSISRRCGSQRMLQLLLTGDCIDASTALDWGLVDEVVPRSALDERLREVARARSRGR